jgi:hypothetical protein
VIAENQKLKSLDNKNNQLEREAKSLKPFKKWFYISPIRVTCRLEGMVIIKLPGTMG